MTRIGLIALCLLVLPALSGCGSGAWFGGGEDPPLPGERLSVLELAENLDPDPRLAGVQVTLPPAVNNPNWSQAGREPNHVMGHLALSVPFSEVWRADIGQGSSGKQRLLTPPIVAGGRVYVPDSDGNLTALSAADGSRIWRVRVAQPDEDGVPLGGGVAFGDGLLFITTGFGEIMALDPANGGQVWHQRTNGPVRAPPTYDRGRVFTVTVDNQLQAFDAGSGEELWSHIGILEVAGLLGGAAPAAGGGIVVAPYSSGEVVAVRIETGRPIWSDSLTAIRRVGALASLADIRGMPVIDGNLVFTISHSGRMVAIDVPSGARAWEQQIGGTQAPVVAGDFIFVLSNNAELIALARETGRVRWVRPLQRWRDPEDRTGPVVWAGPVLAGNHLIVVGSEEDGVLISPYDGDVVDSFELRSGTTIPPIVADRTLFVLTEDGTLTAYR